MISAVVTTFNSSEYLADCLKSLKKSKFIDEIVISDDGSSLNEISNLKKIINESGVSFKIKFYINETNRGAYKNKYDAVMHAKNEIVYLIDSDNIAMYNIDKIFNLIIKEKDKHSLYIPSKIFHFYNSVNIFSRLLNRLLGKIEVFSKRNIELNKKDIQEIFQGEKIIHNKSKSIYWVLNIGNFIFYKSMFLKNTKNTDNFSREDLSLDAVASTYYWLKNGNKIHLLKNFYHFHRKRYDSVSWSEQESTKLSRKKFNNLFLSINKN